MGKWHPLAMYYTIAENYRTILMANIHYVTVQSISVA